MTLHFIYKTSHLLLLGKGEFKASFHGDLTVCPQYGIVPSYMTEPLLEAFEVGVVLKIISSLTLAKSPVENYCGSYE